MATALAIDAAAKPGEDPDAACSRMELKAGALTKSLERFSKKTGVSIVADHRLIAGLDAPAVAAQSNCVDALAAALANTGLDVHQVNGKTLVISQRPQPAHVAAAPDIPTNPFRRPAMHDEIIVTGSRLSQANLSSSSPVLQVDSGEIDTRGVTRVEDLVNILPQAFASQTSDLANGATGTSSLNLRGLGSVRTLVLMDGKRLPFGSPLTSPPNLDIIPAQLVERVDVVTGGASAVYGSDALAGVANFILRRDFEGVMLDGQVGFYQDGNHNDFANALLDANGIERPGGVLDGREVNAAITVGANSTDGRGNVTAFFGYSNQNQVRQDRRDYSTCAYGPADPAPNTIDGVGCVGSSTFRRFFTPGGDLFLSEDNTLVPFTNAPEQTFNFAPDNFQQRPIERFSANFMGRYEIVDDFEVYLDLGFTKNMTDSQIAFSGTFFRSFSTNCDNPFLDTEVFSGDTLADALGCTASMIAAGENVPLIAGYRNITGEPRNSHIDNTTFRTVIGLRGIIADNWSWEVFGQYSQNDMTRITTGDLNFAKTQQALFIVDDGMGNAVCAPSTSLTAAPGCLPFNIFQFNGVSPEAAAFAQGTGVITGVTEQKVIGGTIQGNLGPSGFQSPWAETGIQALLSIEFREDFLGRTPDDVSQLAAGFGLTGAGGGTLPVEGKVSLYEIFMETHIPLMTDQPFFDEFGINGAYRYSNYTTDGNNIENSFDTHTYSTGVSWAVTPNIRFRAQFQRAVRSPNVIELFTEQTSVMFNLPLGANGVFDPCAGPAPAATPAQCANTGVTAAQYGSIPVNPTGQFNAISGGNPLLTQESSDTYTIGGVLTPSQLPDFSLAIDYFNITVDDAISTVAPSIALLECIESGDPTLCSLIKRDRFGSLFLDNSNLEGVNAINANIAQLSTRGVDFAATYNYDFDARGSVSFDYAATYLVSYGSTAVANVTSEIECAGFFAGGCFVPAPKYRHRLLTTWRTPWNIDLVTSWRHFGGVNKFPGTTGTPLDDRLDSANYLDLAAQWHVREDLTLRAGVQNVMGRDPELQTLISTVPGNGGTFPGSYDSLGRYIFFSFTFRQ